MWWRSDQVDASCVPRHAHVPSLTEHNVEIVVAPLAKRVHETNVKRNHAIQHHSALLCAAWYGPATASPASDHTPTSNIT